MDEEKKLKTYKVKNIKFLFSLGFIEVVCVAILLQLVTFGEFLPINDVGGYDWVNILLFIFLTTSIIGAFITLLVYFIMLFIMKREENIQMAVIALKWGIIISIGVLLIFILNFFHILNIFWGFGIFLVIIIISFII